MACGESVGSEPQAVQSVPGGMRKSHSSLGLRGRRFSHVSIRKCRDLDGDPSRYSENASHFASGASRKGHLPETVRRKRLDCAKIADGNRATRTGVQFYLNGYKPGDPDILDESPAARNRPLELPDAVDVLSLIHI